MSTATPLHPIVPAHRGLIGSLMAFATNPGFVHAQCWPQGDVAVWDNRAVMRRAAPFASAAQRRRMVRAAASCPSSVH